MKALFFTLDNLLFFSLFHSEGRVLLIKPAYNVNLQFVTKICHTIELHSGIWKFYSPALIKLLLFFDNLITNIQGGLRKKWDKEPKAFKQKADENWASMK